MPFYQRNNKPQENSHQNLNKKKKGDSGNNLPKQVVNQNKNQSNKMLKKEVNEEDCIIEIFGRIGWICAQCNNFNYDTKNKCNRCGIPQSQKKKEQMKLQQQKKNDDDKIKLDMKFNSNMIVE